LPFSTVACPRSRLKPSPFSALAMRRTEEIVAALDAEMGWPINTQRKEAEDRARSGAKGV